MTQWTVSEKLFQVDDDLPRIKVFPSVFVNYKNPNNQHPNETKQNKN